MAAIYRIGGLLLLATAVAFGQNNAARGGRGNANLIQPLADLERDLKGKLERITVHGKSLEGNLEGDSADREVFVYLPPSYGQEPGRRYPVVYTLQAYAPNLKKMKAIAMDVGLQDGLAQTNRDMDVALTDAGVPHHFETFEGDHNGQVPMYFQTKVLPFFSKELVFGK